MKPHLYADIIGVFTQETFPSPLLNTVAETERPLPSNSNPPHITIPQSAQVSATHRWAQVKDGVAQGQRRTAAAVMAGKLLSDLSCSLWPTAFWPAMQAWNWKNKPPLPDAELKEVAEGILKLEQAKLALAKQERKEQQSGTGWEEASLLALITIDNCQLFHDQHNEPHAHVLVNGHRETWRMNAREMKWWLSDLSWKIRKSTVGDSEMRETLTHLEARAMHDGPQIALETRITYIKEKNAILYSLYDKLWRAVRITTDGYTIIADPGIHFRRFRHHAEQVEPVDGGDLREFLTLTNLATPDQECLFLVHLVSCLVPFIAHPVRNTHGPQGSAKTTLEKMGCGLVDPSIMGTLSFPDKARELVQLLSHHYMACFDNVSKITQEQSDIICRAVTGEGNSKRQLYTDDEDMIYTYRRCVGFTGINPTARKPDLLDRSILIRLDRIPEEKRREERLVLADFETMRPRLVGAMFTALSKAMAIYPTIELKRLPRMADFCRWGCAIAQALGYDDQDFIRAYFANIQEQHDEAIQADQLSTALLVFVRQHPEGWTGKASLLLEELETVAAAEKLSVNAPDWPKRANVLSRRLNEIKTNLREVGIMLDSHRESGGTRTIVLSQAPQNIVTPSSQQEAASESQSDDSDNSDDHPETSIQCPML